MAKPRDTQTVVLPPNGKPVRCPHLVVLEGTSIAQVFRLQEPETIIGRSLDAGVSLPVPSVSRHHAAIQVSRGDVWIKDLGSRNGTFVGVDRIKRPTKLRDGDLIAIGDVVLLKLTYGLAVDRGLRRAAYEGATLDHATRLANTIRFVDQLRVEYAYARRRRFSLVLVFVRVDGLGALGDESKIDRVMGNVATIIAGAVRVEDLVGRAANDEIVALIRGDADQAAAAATRLRVTVAQESTLAADSGAWRTVTVALVPLEAFTVVDPEAILLAAQQKAREAFKGVRNRVIRLPVLDVRPPEGGDPEHLP